MANLNLAQPVLVYHLNSRRKPSPALFAAGQYLAPRVHEEQPLYAVNVPEGSTLEGAMCVFPPPPVPPAYPDV